MSGRWGNPINNNLLYDKQGHLLPGGTVEFFAAGTSDALSVFADEALTVNAGSELTADAFGLLPDFFMRSGTRYKAVVKDSDGAIEWTRDEIFSLDTSVDSRLDNIENAVNTLSAGNNALINGGMRVALRANAVLSSVFQEGRVNKVWGRVTSVTGGVLGHATSTEYSSGSYVVYAGVSTSGASVVESQFRVPAQEAARFVDRPGSFSCTVRHNVGNDVAYTIVFKKPTFTPDGFAALSTIAVSNGIVVASGTNRRLVFSVPDLGDVSNGIAVEVSAVVGAIGGREFRITLAQLEEGLNVTNFSEIGYETALVSVIGDLRFLADRANHSGQQPLSTISGIGALASQNSVLLSQLPALNSNIFPAPSAGSNHLQKGFGGFQMANAGGAGPGDVRFRRFSARRSGILRLLGTVPGILGQSSFTAGMTVINEETAGQIASTGVVTFPGGGGSLVVDLNIVAGTTYLIDVFGSATLSPVNINNVRLMSGNDTGNQVIV